MTVDELNATITGSKTVLVDFGASLVPALQTDGAGFKKLERKQQRKIYFYKCRWRP